MTTGYINPSYGTPQWAWPRTGRERSYRIYGSDPETPQAELVFGGYPL